MKTYLYDLSQSLNPDFSLADHMDFIYNMRDDLNHKLDLGYAQVDIEYQRFLEQVELSERERDLIYISHFFNSAWKTIHITFLSLKEQPSELSLHQVKKVFEYLNKYNLQHLLYNKLSEKQFLKILKRMGV